MQDTCCILQEFRIPEQTKNLHVFQIMGEHCDQQETFLSDLLSIPLLSGHQEARLVSPQLCHHLTRQEAHSLKKSMAQQIKTQNI